VHLRLVVPHLLDQKNGRRQRFPLVRWWSDGAPNTIDGMAFGAALLFQESLAALSFARLFEVASGIEISEQAAIPAGV
jgi:hypothetical protein